ncbi:hypothetical protein SNE40_001499 [Patella caerulea]|uniref:Uncharacterized protein n=1 Tax=Patella caerulea TaxID=87958 RepID=A0AAN8KIU8_PATCE
MLQYNSNSCHLDDGMDEQTNLNRPFGDKDDLTEVLPDARFVTVQRWYQYISISLIFISCISILAGIITVNVVADEPLLTFFTGSPIWTGAVGLIAGALVFVDWRNMNQNGPPLTTSTLVLLHFMFEMLCAAFCLFMTVWNATGCMSEIAIQKSCHTDRPSNMSTAIADYIICIFLLLNSLIIPIFVIINRNIFGSKTIDERLKEIEARLQIRMNDMQTEASLRRPCTYDTVY